MPAEWEPHEATWIAWPHNRDDWPGKFAPIPWVYAEIVRHLSRVERVNILVKGAKGEAPARPTGSTAPGVDLDRVDVRQGGDRPRLDSATRGRRSSSTTTPGDRTAASAWSTGGSTPGRSTTTTATTTASRGGSPGGSA